MSVDETRLRRRSPRKQGRRVGRLHVSHASTHKKARDFDSDSVSFLPLLVLARLVRVDGVLDSEAGGVLLWHFCPRIICVAQCEMR